MNDDALHEGINVREHDVIWIQNGLFHRENGPAIQHALGYSAWFLEGVRHRVDGPAIEWQNGDKEWFVHGLRHCEDGPAYIDHAGNVEWWINDVQYTEEEFNQWLSKKKLNEELQSALQEKFQNKKIKI
jgi:hypothetical protein